MEIIKRTVTANSNKLITTNGEAAPSLKGKHFIM